VAGGGCIIELDAIIKIGGLQMLFFANPELAGDFCVAVSSVSIMRVS
jgi:hypothetical protein